jgi:hypothetical protein
MDIISDYRPIIQNIRHYKYRYLVYLSGRLGLAKSTNIARALLTIAMMKRLKIACVRETQNSIKDSVHAQLSDEIINNALPFEIYKESIYCPATGSEIIFKGLKETNQHNIRSMANIDVAFIEEAQAISTTSWESFAPTIRKAGSFIIIAGNPDEESDVVYQLFGPEAPRRPDVYYCYKDFRYNPFKLPKSVLQDIAMMKANRPDDYERIYLGRLRTAVDMPVVRSWNPEKNIGIGKESNTIYWSLDFNVNPQCSVICHWNGGSDFYFSDEIVLENVSTYRVAEEFVKLYKKKYDGRPLVINGDASGRNRSSNSEFSNYAIIEQVLTKERIRFDFQVPKANTSISNRVNNFDWHVRGLDGKPHILVNPECRHLCHSCKLLSYDKNGNIIEVPARPGMKTIDYAKSHIFDAASYCVMANDPVLENFVKVEKPRTQTIKEMWELSLKKAAGGGVYV